MFFLRYYFVLYTYSRPRVESSVCTVYVYSKSVFGCDGTERLKRGYEPQGKKNVLLPYCGTCRRLRSGRCFWLCNAVTELHSPRVLYLAMRFNLFIMAPTLFGTNYLEFV